MSALGKRMGRKAPVAAPGTDLSGIDRLHLIDITLLSDVGGTTRSVPHLGLGFGPPGMTVTRTNGESVVSIPWTNLRELSTGTPDGTEKGATGVALVVQSDRQAHRFIVPNVQPEALKGALSAVAPRYGTTAVGDMAAKKGFRLR